MSGRVITNLLVQVTMQLAMLLTPLVVTHRRFGTAHNQLVLIRIGLNTTKTNTSLTNEKRELLYYCSSQGRGLNGGKYYWYQNKFALLGACESAVGPPAGFTGNECSLSVLLGQRAIHG